VPDAGGHVPDHPVMPTKPEVVAVIDDDLGVRSAISRLLSVLGYSVELYASAKEFLDAAMAPEAICLILDIEPGDSGGIEFAQRLVNAGVTTPIIFMTAHDNELFKKRALKMGCIAFFRKPFSADVLIEALRTIPRHP
jgi:FixJ family two-component response regulator